MSFVPALPGATASPATISPNFLSTVFPNGIPNATTNPATASTIDASQFGASPLVAQIMAEVQPTFAQQNRALTENLANAGIVGGSTAGAVDQLAGQQIAQLLAGLVPVESSANALKLSALQGNQGALNQASLFNAGAENAGSQFNTSTDIGAAQYDTGTANSILSQILGMQNSGYLQQQQDQLALQQQAAGDKTGAFQPIFQQPAPVSFGGLAQSIAPTAYSAPGVATTPGAGSVGENRASVTYGG